MAQDMTRGKISKKLFLFSIPIFIVGICQTFYNILDSVIIGNYESAGALASVGTCSSLIIFFMILSNGFSTGFRVVTGQLFGAKQMKKLALAINTSLVIMIILGVFSGFLGFLLSETMLVAMKVPAHLLLDAQTYLKIYFLSMPFIIIHTGISNIFYSLGDSKIPMIIQLSSFSVNIALQILLIAVFKMGVAGAATSGLITHTANCVIMLILIIKKRNLLNKYSALFDKTICKNILRFAIASGLGHSVGSINALLVSRLVNSYDTAIIAGYSIATRVEALLILAINTVASAIETFSAQNFGTHRYKRIMKGFKVAVIFNIIYSIGLVFVMRIFGANLINLFLNKNTEPILLDEIIKYTTAHLLVLSVFYSIYGIGHVVNALLRNTNKIKLTVCCTITIVATRLTTTYIFSNFIGERALYWCLPVSWFSGYCITFIYVVTKRWLPHRRALVNRRRIASLKSSV